VFGDGNYDWLYTTPFSKSIRVYGKTRDDTRVIKVGQVVTYVISDNGTVSITDVKTPK